MNKTTMGGFSKAQTAVPSTSQDFYIQSKDKRHYMHAPEVKQHILDENMRKTKGLLMNTQGSSKIKSQQEQYEFKLNDTTPA